HIHALTATLTSLERYHGLFRDYIRTQRQLGGEPYEKPKASPFKDADMFTMGEDDPAYLYAAAIKGGTNLPTTVKTDLNRAMLGMRNSGEKTMLLIDSMSNAFHGPLITVTTDSAALPYRLLYAASRELKTCKQHRDALNTALREYYAKACPLVAPVGDYIHSVKPLTEGLDISQRLLNNLRNRENPERVYQDLIALDSLAKYLEGAELTLLKGISPIGNSKQFPNKGNFNGFDLYNKYEDIVAQFKALAGAGIARFLAEKDNAAATVELLGPFIERYNGNQGFIYLYNEYVQLIGGGKMKLLSSGAGKSKYIYRGWSDGSKTLPLRTLLLGMKDVPVFEVVGW
ncbi:MAG: hypothetical protein RLZZ519_1265, partial [Bacteroidota bacterium]